MDQLTLAVRTVLRGVSQVFLQNHALAGAFMVAGIATYSIRMAGLVLLGAIVQTVFARAAGRDTVDGLMGYNGALVGAAAHLDLAGPVPAVCATVLGALSCIPLHAGVERLFGSRPLARFGLPVLTAPFCVVAGGMLTIVRDLVPPAPPLTASPHAWPGAELGLVNALAEVFLADGALAGALILAGLFVAGWRVGLWAVLGSVVAVAFGWLGNADRWDLSAGLLGYSSTLVAIAVGVTFLTGRSLGLRLVAGVVGCLATVGVRELMLLGPVPVYTWPFVLVTWVVLAAVALVPARRG